MHRWLPPPLRAQLYIGWHYVGGYADVLDALDTPGAALPAATPRAASHLGGFGSAVRRPP